jgi:ribosome-associated protein
MALFLRKCAANNSLQRISGLITTTCMIENYPTSKELSSELGFSTSRSSGPGGQNVNKVNSKVTLKWIINDSRILDPAQKELITQKLYSRITQNGTLILTAQDARSQIQNKAEVIAKLDALLKKAFTPRKARKPTKPGKAAKQKRLNSKKQNSEKKQRRKKI